MPYVKISDPSIIDLAAWHQVINVVNQHSDSINAITNNFGVQGSGTVDWNADNDVAHEFSSGPQKMLYGRTKINTANNSSYKNNKQFFYGDVNFVDQTSGTTAFSAKPVVTGTIQFGHTSIDALDDTDHNIIVTIYGVTESKFSYRVTRAISTDTKPEPLTGYFYLNWHAMGPK
jgi:hypothetical protein